VVNKIIWAISFLKEAAAVWKIIIIIDYFENNKSERKIVINRIFENWNYFKVEIRKILDDPIRDRIAAGEIRRLKQYILAARYAAKFKKVAVDLE
jgi:hypothetical protein